MFIEERRWNKVYLAITECIYIAVYTDKQLYCKYYYPATFLLTTKRQQPLLKKRGKLVATATVFVVMGDVRHLEATLVYSNTPPNLKARLLIKT